MSTANGLPSATASPTSTWPRLARAEKSPMTRESEPLARFTSAPRRDFPQRAKIELVADGCRLFNRKNGKGGQKNVNLKKKKRRRGLVAGYYLAWSLTVRVFYSGFYHLFFCSHPIFLSALFLSHIFPVRACARLPTSPKPPTAGLPNISR